MVKPFVLIVVDRDKGEFSVEGPMTDDNSWNAAVFEEQKKGRQVNCSTPGEDTRADVEATASMYAKQYGYKRVPAGSVVSRPR